MSSTQTSESPPEHTTEPSTETETDTDESPSSEASEEGSGMKRVNITIHPVRHRVLSEFAEDNGMNFSDIARRGAELVRQRKLNDDMPREFQPLYQEIRKLRSQVEELATETEESQDRLTRLLEERNDWLTSTGDGAHSDEQIKERLYDFLKETGAHSIPELVEATKFDRNAIQRAIGQLRDMHAVVEVDAETDVPHWEVK